MKLYGGIEGIFDLLVSNTDALSHTGISLEDTLRQGTKLNYTADFRVNNDIAKWLTKNNVKVRNGEHVYRHYDIVPYAIAYARQHNLSLVRNAILLWPDIKCYSAQEVDEKTVVDFLKYINAHRIWTGAVTEAQISAFENGDYASVTNITPPDRLGIPRMVVQHVGQYSTFTYSLKKLKVMIVDWGDNTPPEMCVRTSTRTTAEHCYEDSGTHVIRIYGDFVFSFLDLRGLGGVYYPISEIEVSGDFYSDLQTNTTINRLITRT